MANNYTISPGTIVGNESISGDLDVDTGSASPMELGVGASFAAIGINLKKDTITRFNGAGPAFQLALRLANGIPFYVVQKAAGSQALVGVLLGQPCQCGNVVNTGNITENTIFSSTIRGGTIGIVGFMKFMLCVHTTVQGAGSTTVRIKYGATVIGSFGIASATDRKYEGELGNNNFQNQNFYCAVLHQNGASPGLSVTNPNVDTSVDATLSVTCQNANNTDSHQFNMLAGHIIPSDISF